MSMEIRPALRALRGVSIGNIVRGILVFLPKDYYFQQSDLWSFLRTLQELDPDTVQFDFAEVHVILGQLRRHGSMVMIIESFMQRHLQEFLFRSGILPARETALRALATEFMGFSFQKTRPARPRLISIP